MISTVKEENVVPEFTYPRLMRYHDGAILLVTGEGDVKKCFKGVCIHAGPGARVGQEMNTWTSRDLENFLGEVTLRNGDE